MGELLHSVKLSHGPIRLFFGNFTMSIGASVSINGCPWISLEDDIDNFWETAGYLILPLFSAIGKTVFSTTGSPQDDRFFIEFTNGVSLEIKASGSRQGNFIFSSNYLNPDIFCSG